MKGYMNASLPPRKRAELLLGDPAEASMEAFASVDQQVSADYPPPASGAATRKKLCASLRDSEGAGRFAFYESAKAAHCVDVFFLV